VLAIACRQAGLTVRIYEQASGPSGSEDLLELGANATRVLHALGLKAALQQQAAIPDFITARSASSGFLLSQRALGAFSEARYSAPFLLLSCRSLVALLDASRRDHGIPLEMDAAVTGLDTASATLTLGAEARFRYASVAIATGADSANPLANLLEPREWATDNQTTVIVAVCRRESPVRDHGRFINQWLGRGACCLERPIPTNGSEAEQRCELLLTSTSQPTGIAEQDLREWLQGAHPAVRSLAPGILQARYLTRPVAPVAEHWYAGRTALLGSICHPPAPYSTLGAATAIEDAWVLSRMMERNEDAPHRDFADYQRFRRPRALRLRTHERSELDTHTLAHPGAIWRRNLSSALVSRFLPELTMQRWDWLYGYDCIKGFA
jgi:salicylate hydroxylase